MILDQIPELKALTAQQKITQSRARARKNG